MPEFKDFLSSKSMLTPGIAGGVSMLITNALHSQLGLPAVWVALALSFLLGALVLGDKSTAGWQKPIFYLLNSLIIFAMATGANTGAVAAVETSGPSGFDVGRGSGEVASFFQPWFGGGG
ncbi:MAG TPA: hypothetical protein VLF66_16265 [Thermoanaerobaculia bacterium]|nr:hypothetical protein [Thermoanaerobaculia bacterium]